MSVSRPKPAKTRRILAAGAGAAAVLAALVYWQWPGSGPGSAAVLKPGDAAVVAGGAKIYAANCASCHGAGLEGAPDWQSPGADGLMPAPPHDATGHTWHHPDAVLFAITKYGVARAAKLEDYKSAMPAYEGLLTDEEIVAALSWIKAQWPDEIRNRHDQLNAQYRAR